MDGAKIWQIITQRITAPKYRLAVLENVPGKTKSWAEIVFIFVVKGPLGKGNKAVRVGCRIIGQEVCAQIVVFTQGAGNVPA